LYRKHVLVPGFRFLVPCFKTVNKSRTWNLELGTWDLEPGTIEQCTPTITIKK